MKPNAEAFARIVLSELAKLRASNLALRVRLYQQLTSTPGWEQSFQEMQSEDDNHMAAYHLEWLNQSLAECGLSPDSTPPHTEL